VRKPALFDCDRYCSGPGSERAPSSHPAVSCTAEGQRRQPTTPQTRGEDVAARTFDRATKLELARRPTARHGPVRPQQVLRPPHQSLVFHPRRDLRQPAHQVGPGGLLPRRPLRVHPFANRTDFIRTAIRRQLEHRSSAVDRTVARRALTLGSERYSRHDLEELRDSGRMVELRVLGLASIAEDVSPELALATIAAVEVLGAFRAPPAVKAALASRTT
jgi:Ribbon-Helix-Helix transcriptional regulator family